MGEFLNGLVKDIFYDCSFASLYGDLMDFFTDREIVLVIRKALGMNMSQLAKKLDVSTTLVSSIEREKKNLTVTIKGRFVEKLGVNEDWIFHGEGDFFAEQTPNASKLNQAAAKAYQEISQPASGPIAAASSAIGISTKVMIRRLCQAYSAKNMKELAIDHLHISSNAISGWIKRNKIPEDQILKAIGEGKITPEQLLSNDEYVLIKKADLVEIYRKMYVGKDAKRPIMPYEIEEELNRQLKQREDKNKGNEGRDSELT